MKRFLRYLVVGLGIIVLQTAVLPHFLKIQMRPDLLLILVLYLSLPALSCSGAFYAWSLGCLFDVFTGTTLGLYGIVMLIIFCVTGSVGQQFHRDNYMTMIVATTLGTIAQTGLLIFMLLCFSNNGQQYWLEIVKQLPLQLVLNLATVFVIIVILEQVKKTNYRHLLHILTPRGKSQWH
ncbi:MAG: rod shape-determining protein MreD [Desulfobacteraceae bacterium 4572_35.1]|nr:MAG: rod shape-determining protein MreD [Desulfobacteraceae bacterium 4572_35.1]